MTWRNYLPSPLHAVRTCQTSGDVRTCPENVWGCGERVCHSGWVPSADATPAVQWLPVVQIHYCGWCLVLLRTFPQEATRSNKNLPKWSKVNKTGLKKNGAFFRKQKSLLKQVRDFRWTLEFAQVDHLLTFKWRFLKSASRSNPPHFHSVSQVSPQ